ncbi:ABC transporter permease [Priestia megaterium]|uniref:ABC transporter permease n=1 Tax=Priestia megaterium TaxID=1404 RepID=UPI0025A338C8|nr:hypothetical protein [Priestia megaterium]MDM8151180.1 hypothetical protein [Priestia megaterium]
MLSRQGVNAIVAMAAGYITGYLTAKAKLPTFIVTLGISTYIRGMAYVLSTGYPIALSDPLFKSFRSGTVFATPMPVFIVASTYVNAFLPFGYTMFDRHIYAIGGIEEASSPTGIKVGANLIKVYI